MYERYCTIRDSRGFRDADIARLTGITPSTFSDWKNGKSAPNAVKLIAIARVLKTTAEYLVTGTDTLALSDPLSDDEWELVRGYREASGPVREMMLAGARSALKGSGDRSADSTGDETA